MASGLPPTEPPGTPSTPAFVAPDNRHGEPAFRFTCDDYDDGRNQDKQTLDPPFASSPERKHFLAASSRSSPAAFLHPHHSTSLRPPTPESAFAMATEDGLANGDSSSPAPKNPFNFQTQFISAGPVKSVCGRFLDRILVGDGELEQTG